MAERFEAQLEAVRTALADRRAGAARLVKTLRGNNGMLVGTIADALDEGDAALLDELPAAFARLLDDASKRDPGCRGKIAIARVLDRVERRDTDVFERGVRHVQLEPVWGGRVDTAAELRGICGMALVHARHERALVEVAVLLADPQPRARIAAARAIAASGDRGVGEPLLRLRIAVGEPEPEVLGECFAALLELMGGAAIDDVAGFLSHSDAAIAEAAALAIGGSRLPGAFATLRDAGEVLLGASRRIRMLAIALVRTPEAYDWLLAQIDDGERGTAEDAIRALATFRHDDELMHRVRAAVAGHAALSRVLDSLLDDE